MDRLRQDLIVSFRRLRKSPAFNACAIITLALGIGANTTIFTAVNALLFRPLPVEKSNELAFLNTRLKVDVPTMSVPNYRDFRDRNDVFSGLITYAITPLSYSRGAGNNGTLWGYLVSGNYFDVLGVKPERGRFLHAEDDVNKGGHPVAVISHNCWQRKFAGDPDVTGKNVKLNGLDYKIVGVAQPGFFGTEVIITPDIWVPMAMQPQIQPGADWIDSRGAGNSFVLGRLKPGVTWAHAEASLNAIADRLGQEYPRDNAGMKIVLSPPGLGGTYFRGPVLGFSSVLMAVAGLVLLIACVNLASLLLARGADRRKEIAIRLALGASRGQLVRQLLTESAILSLAGGLAGVLLAYWLTSVAAVWKPPVDFPIVPALHVDVRVVLFAALASVVAGLLFGLAPALQATRSDVAPAIKSEAPVTRLRRFQLRDGLVAAQVALSVVLLVGSVLVVKSLQHALQLNLGFEPAHAAALSMDLSLQGYDKARGREFHRRLLDKVRSMPGVEGAGLISGLPLTLNISNDGVYIEGKPEPKMADLPMVGYYRVSTGYFKAAHTRIVEGRDFEERDKDGAKPVIIVNQAFAKQLLPNEDPIGKRMRSGPNEEWREIIGVVEDGKYRSLGESPFTVMFYPYLQTSSPDATLVARSSLPEAQLTKMLVKAVTEVDPSVSVRSPGSLAQQLGLALFPAKLAASVLGAFGGLAVILAAVGVYGIMAYAVARRTREIGIRMALGAQSGDVIRTVFNRAGLLLGIGAVLGTVLSLAIGRFFSVLLYGVSPRDPMTYAIVLGMLAVVTLCACWYPMRKAVGIQPVTALRME